MRTALLALTFLLLFPMTLLAQTTAALADIWDKQHVSHIMPSDVHHKDLQKYLEGLKKIGVKVEEVGRSYQNREIYQAEFGNGPLKVFMWSQMHGDEPTATSALIDMLTFLQNNRQLP
ncbi:MAG: M14 family zinc carboxypeptidase, partial [Candidatus Binatia bacterium]